MCRDRDAHACAGVEVTYPRCKELVFCQMEGVRKSVEVRGPFDRVQVIGAYGWVHGAGESLCFDPAKYVNVSYRDGHGAWHRDGHYPSRSR